MVHILVVSGIRLYREGLKLLLARDPRFEVVESVCSIDQAFVQAEILCPDLLLLDLALDDALPAVRNLLEVLPDSRVVALGVPVVESEIVACVEAGVAGYVLRDASVQELADTLISAARGELRCSAGIAGALQRRLAVLAAHGSHEDEPRLMLTRREGEIAEFVDQGLTNKEIAVRLTIEVATVKNHVHNILGKLGVHTRGEAAAKLRRWGHRLAWPSSSTIPR